MDMPTIIIMSSLVVLCVVWSVRIGDFIADMKRDRSPVINISPVELGQNDSSIIIANAIKESLERVAETGGAT